MWAQLPLMAEPIWILSIGRDVPEAANFSSVSLKLWIVNKQQDFPQWKGGEGEDMEGLMLATSSPGMPGGVKICQKSQLLQNTTDSASNSQIYCSPCFLLFPLTLTAIVPLFLAFNMSQQIPTKSSVSRCWVVRRQSFTLLALQSIYFLWVFELRLLD